MPVMLYLATKNDPFASWADQITARDTLQSAHRGHAFSWAMGAHETTSPAFGLLSCDVSSRDTSVCYGKALFKLNAPYLATSNSSIDDNPGTATTTANGLYDGDYSGCVNCGFTWNFTTDNAGTLAFTVDNTWMDKTPTANPQTTLTGSIASSGTGSVTVTDGSVFQSTSTYPYFLVGGTEVIQVTGVSGNTVTYTTRGLFGSSSQSHASSQTIMQFVSKNDRAERWSVFVDDGRHHAAPAAGLPQVGWHDDHLYRYPERRKPGDEDRHGGRIERRVHDHRHQDQRFRRDQRLVQLLTRSSNK